jgi:hypothetical protein
MERSWNGRFIAIHLVQWVRLGVGIYLHYFSARSEHFLPKGLSQIFDPIPGGGHATPRVELFMFMKALWRYTTAHSKSNTATDVSNSTFSYFLRNFVEIFAPIPGGPTILNAPPRRPYCLDCGQIYREM